MDDVRHVNDTGTAPGAAPALVRKPHRILVTSIGVAAFVLAGCSSSKPAQPVPKPLVGLSTTTTTENPGIGFFNTTTTVPAP
jgi:hypothetical protein